MQIWDLQKCHLEGLGDTCSEFRAWLHPDRIEAVLDYLAASGQEHAISFRWRPFLDDPDDDFVLELAVAAGAGYIVTHNWRDFAGVEKFGLQTVTPSQMLMKLQETV